MSLPEKFTKYPWVSMVIVAAVVAGFLYAVVQIFGPDRTGAWVDRALCQVLQDCEPKGPAG